MITHSIKYIFTIDQADGNSGASTLTQAGLPSDPAMLLSYINTRLRDDYDSLDELCASIGISKTELTDTLSNAGFDYSAENNKFW